MEHEPGNMKAVPDVYKTATGHHEIINNDQVEYEKASTIERSAPELVARLSPEERIKLERRIVRKIDIRLLPPLIIMYILNYLDRNNIATARITGSTGLQADLKLTNTEYQTCVSILFVGYILMQVPSNLFLNKIGKPALYLPACMVVWGTISAATAAAHNYAGLLAIRFFLGFVEAAYFPGCLFFLSCWYTRKELAFRSAVLYSGSLISGAFAGLIAAGITSGMDGKDGIAAWRWLFIIEGVVTIGVALIAFFILPNFPRTTSWLTEEERQLAVWRLEEDIGIDDWVSSEQQSFWHGMVLAVKDIKVWILLVGLLGIVSSASVTNFFPSVVQTLGYSNTNTLLLTAPPYILSMITAFLNAWHSDKTGEKTLHICIPLIIAIAAFILAAATSTTAPRYVAMMLMLQLYAGYVVVLAWISNTIPRPPAKRAAALALINAVSNASSIYASYLYFGGPRYIVAFAVDCCTLVLALAMTVLLRIILVRLNKKFDAADIPSTSLNTINAEEMKAARKGFRYLV